MENGSRIKNANTHRQNDICKGGISSRISLASRKFPDQNNGGKEAIIYAVKLLREVDLIFEGNVLQPKID